MRKSLMLASVATAVHALAFENKPGWKLDENGAVVLHNGNPVFVGADGKEATIDQNTIGRLNAEARQHRERAEAAEAAYEPFKGLDATAARDAIEKLSKIDQKVLIDAGEVDRVRDEISKQYTAQIGERDTKISDLQSKLDGRTLELAFKSSTYVADNIAVPPEMFFATFAKNFKVENDAIVPYDTAGNKINSKKRIGELADIDEAFEMMVEQYPYKDTILRTDARGGTGSTGNGGNRGGGRMIKRADFDALPPMKQAEVASAVGKGEMQLID